MMMISSIVYSQDYKSDFLKVQNFYRNASNLSMKVNVHAYSSESDKNGYSMGTGVMYKSEKKYYSNFMNTEMIDDGKSMLILDHEAKQAVYAPDRSAMKNRKNMSEVIDTLVSGTKNIKFIEKKDDRVIYECTIDQGIISSYKIFIQPSTGHFKRIEYIYRNDHPDYDVDIYKVVVNYTEIFTKKPSYSFSISNYLEQKAGKYILKGKVSGYQLEQLAKTNPYLNSLTR